jgi:hypothetical protein
MVLIWKLLVYFVALWSVLRLFGIFDSLGFVCYIFPILVSFTKNNLAALGRSRLLCQDLESNFFALFLRPKLWSVFFEHGHVPRLHNSNARNMNRVTR